jgi:hypothetical protein
MTKKKVFPQASPASTEKSPVMALTARPKRPKSVVKRTAAKKSVASKPNPRQSVVKVQAVSDPSGAPEPRSKPITAALPAKTVRPPSSKPSGKSQDKALTPSASPAAAKTSSRQPTRSSRRSSARPPTHTRKPAQAKTAASPCTPDTAVSTALLAQHTLPSEQASGSSAPVTNSAKSVQADKAAAASVTPPVANDAELWEQGSPISSRIAQLRTRNSLLDIQLQRLRTPIQVRGKKK